MNETTAILWRRDLMARYRVSRPTIFRWEARGQLPKPDVVLGDKTGWYVSTILEAERLSAAEQQPAA